MPPLGPAIQAFRVRDWTNKNRIIARRNGPCKVIVDIQDAWPETFYRAFPKTVPTWLQSALLAGFHRSCGKCYINADRISPSAKPTSIWQTDTKVRNAKVPKISSSNLSLKDSQSSKLEENRHLCYLGALLPSLRTLGRVESHSNTLHLVYIGAFETGYDLETPLRALATRGITSQMVTSNFILQEKDRPRPT